MLQHGRMFEFAAQVLRQSIILTVRWMGTSLPAIVVTLIIVPAIAFVRTFWKQGRYASWRKLRENLQITGVVTLAIWFVIILFNALYTIPHQITVQAGSTVAPPLRLPRPPEFALVK